MMSSNDSPYNLSVSKLVKSQNLSFIASLNQKADILRANGKNILKLSGGDPSHFPEKLLSILKEIKINAKESIFNYSPIAGFENIKKLISSIVSKRYQNEYKKENILICSGGCSGLFLTLKTLLNPGDKVLIQDPCWEYLPRLVENCGGIPVKMRFFLRLEREDNWDELVDEIKKHIISGVKVISFNSPLNPTGKIIPNHILNQIIKVCDDCGVWFLSDDVTIDFSYEDKKKSKIKNLKNFISVNSFSKNLGITGLRIGYVAASEYIINHLKKTQLYTFMYPNSLTQKMMETYLSNYKEDYFEFINKVTLQYEQNATEYVSLLSSVEELEINKPDGGLFLFPKIKSGIPIDFNQLLEKYYVAVAPGLAFSLKCDCSFRIFLGISKTEMIKAVTAFKNYFYETSSLKI